MKLSRFTTAVFAGGLAFCLFGNRLARSQENQSEPQKVPGFIDLKTGQFSPVQAVHPVPETATTTFTTGTIELTLTIDIVSDLPAKTDILCGMNINVTSQNTATGGLGKWIETDAVLATVHGSTATCKLIVPYYWLLPTAASDEITTLNGQFTVTAKDVGAVPAVVRSTDQPFVSTTNIPSNYSVTKFRANATI